MYVGLSTTEEKIGASNKMINEEEKKMSEYIKKIEELEEAKKVLELN